MAPDDKALDAGLNELPWCSLARLTLFNPHATRSFGKSRLPLTLQAFIASEAPPKQHGELA